MYLLFLLVFQVYNDKVCLCVSVMGFEWFDVSVVGVTFKKCRGISASQVL